MKNGQWTQERREAQAARQQEIWRLRRQDPEKFKAVREAISEGRTGVSVGSRKGIGGWKVKNRISPKCLEGCLCSRHLMRNSGQFQRGQPPVNLRAADNFIAWRERQREWPNGTSYEGQFTYTLRAQVWERDQGQCQDCGRVVSAGERSGVVHHVDLDKGHNELENLTLLCRSCHMKRHDRDWHGRIINLT